MRKEYLACEVATVVAGVRIIPIVRISISYAEIRGARSFYAGKHPVYLVISSTEGERAYSITGREVPIQQVISDCPAVAVAPERQIVPPLPPR
jgi:hypothetical protein